MPALRPNLRLGSTTQRSLGLQEKTHALQTQAGEAEEKKAEETDRQLDLGRLRVDDVNCRNCKHWTSDCWQHKDGRWTSYGRFDGELKGLCKLTGQAKFETDTCSHWTDKRQMDLLEAVS